MREDRYFVDKRGGCIAVRDRRHTDPDYPGLHSDTEGVVKFWDGETKNTPCPTCQHPRTDFVLPEEFIQEAHALCDSLNEKERESAGNTTTFQKGDDVVLTTWVYTDSDNDVRCHQGIYADDPELRTQDIVRDAYVALQKIIFGKDADDNPSEVEVQEWRDELCQVGQILFRKGKVIQEDPDTLQVAVRFDLPPGVWEV